MASVLVLVGILGHRFLSQYSALDVALELNGVLEVIFFSFLFLLIFLQIVDSVAFCLNWGSMARWKEALPEND
ncbi:hypothetical protein BHE74_00044042 [Ensete ventricosum]|uniref:Uncharacterized protein n=1 Tax=Ensete ventricosum TaxID=4639 RepID=A0A426Z5N4_ENSVE|nr:hypothetical protein B296_00025727 [Ensete ventricosum]RWV94030.1 hypothetical protein GW17_00043472 [Ensete ventricosum]RWW49743.1 hypothetical protein BHE74_00044042 [Ensete ventricosum]RZS14626.1 hypothetical protein BHM03_00046346 [Ensete ventricosum]